MNLFVEALHKLPLDVALAGLFNFLESEALLFSRQSLEVTDTDVRANVFAEHGNVDVLRKPRDQAIGFGQGRTSFEQ